MPKSLRSGLLLLCSLVCACGEQGSVGSDRCFGPRTRCDQQPHDEVIDLAAARLVDVNVEDAAEATLGWRRPFECAEACYGATIVADGATGVWTPLNASSLNTIRYAHLDARGTPDVQGELAPPAGAAAPFFTAWAADGSGGLAILATWYQDEGDGNAADRAPLLYELIRVDQIGVTRRLLADQTSLIERSLLGSILTPRDGQFAMSTAALETPAALRAVDDQGELLWQQVYFPAWAKLFRQIAALPDGFVVYATRDTADASLESLLTPSSGLLWVDGDGNLLRTALLPAAWAAPPALLALGDGSLAMAGTLTRAADPVQALLLTTDLYLFRIDAALSASGHRIPGTDVTTGVHAFVQDPQDNLYLTSAGGTRAAPFALVCMFAAEAEPACYRLPPGLFPYALVAPEERVLYAITDSELVRFELPR
jgi:hypothetical protein